MNRFQAAETKEAVVVDSVAAVEIISIKAAETQWEAAEADFKVCLVTSLAQVLFQFFVFTFVDTNS